MSEINKRVQQTRKSQKLTQKEMAQKLDLKTTTYSQMERSGKIPCETLIIIAEILNTDIRYFLYGENYPQKEIVIVKETIKEPEPPKIIEKDIFADENERYLILTYRNLRPKEKQEAYSMFMKHFNMNVIFQRRREEKEKQRLLNAQK